MLLAAAPAANVATIAVSTLSDALADDGACSLREAVDAADRDATTGGCVGCADQDTILVPAGTFTTAIPGAVI